MAQLQCLPGTKARSYYMDLYWLLAAPVDLSPGLPYPPGEDDAEPSPWTMLTKVVETTDEAGLLPALSRVAL